MASMVFLAFADPCKLSSLSPASAATHRANNSQESCLKHFGSPLEFNIEMPILNGTPNLAPLPADESWF